MSDQKMDIIDLDGVEIPCRFLFPESRSFFKKVIIREAAFQEPCIQLGDEEMRLFYAQYPREQQNAIAEIKLLIPLVSDWLADHGRILMHGVAFAYKERAWILTAPSGTGKTTQYINLRRLYGDSIRIISGDNPILHFLEDGVIMVCPSPWNGKEHFGNNIRAELGGIILLEQGESDRFYELAYPDRVVPLLSQIMTYMKTEDIIHKQLDYERRIIRSVPMIQYTNTGTLESSARLIAQIETWCQQDSLQSSHIGNQL